jgi:predicted TIM-barrel fold metal-dependent hydrolase
MKQPFSLRIDAYSHISPPKYTEAIRKAYPEFYNQILGNVPPLFDMDERFRIMDQYGQIIQVLTVGPVPPLEGFADAKKSVELAKLANDEMAELVLKHRDRFLAAIALLPMNNIQAALKETDRTIDEMGFRGIYLHTNINGKPLDAPEFLPLFQKMAEYDLPIYTHPWRGNDLKVITHHCGGMVPFYEQRIVQHYSQRKTRYHDYGSYMRGLSKQPIEYYKMFYNDTAIHGNTPALMLAYHFCGADHIVFGADMPLGDHYLGSRSYRQTINAIEAMEITEDEKDMIFVDNALKLLKLTI